MENQEINYARYKESFSDKIIQENSEWVVKRLYKVNGYDSLIGEWVNIPSKSRTKILPVSSVGMFKEIKQILFVRRKALDDLLKPIEVYIKIIQKISVINKTNNIFLIESNGRIFVSDLSTTCPVQLNTLNKGLEKHVIKEEKMSQKELTQLKEDLANPKKIHPYIVEELQNGERRWVC